MWNSSTARCNCISAVLSLMYTQFFLIASFLFRSFDATQKNICAVEIKKLTRVSEWEREGKNERTWNAEKYSHGKNIKSVRGKRIKRWKKCILKATLNNLGAFSHTHGILVAAKKQKNDSWLKLEVLWVRDTYAVVA